MTIALIPVGTECQDTKHGARCRVRGYRLGQAPMNATAAPSAVKVEVELLENATIPLHTQRGPILFGKGDRIQTTLDKLTVAP